jgi:hypothetical protein
MRFISIGPALALAALAVSVPSVTRAAKEREAPRAEPGTIRWAVKTAADHDAKTRDLKPAETTVEDLLALDRPVQLPRGGGQEYQELRMSPAETTLWVLEADVVHYRLTKEGDYLLTLRGEKGKTILAALPNPAFVDDSSPWKQRMTLARRIFEARFTPEPEQKNAKSHALVTGFGYFNTEPARPGEAPNGFEIHPVTGLKFVLPQKGPARPKVQKIKTKRKH